MLTRLVCLGRGILGSGVQTEKGVTLGRRTSCVCWHDGSFCPALAPRSPQSEARRSAPNSHPSCVMRFKKRGGRGRGGRRWGAPERAPAYIETWRQQQGDHTRHNTPLALWVFPLLERWTVKTVSATANGAVKHRTDRLFVLREMPFGVSVCSLVSPSNQHIM